jgi:tellurite resistance-related uncharacterized protein
MHSLPRTAQAYRRTVTFTQDTVPGELLYRHVTREGDWAKINILYGNLVYRILAPQVEEVRLGPSRSGVVAPQVLHQVQLTGPVAFYVEFYRV